MEKTIEQNKQEFIDIFKNNIKREGSDKLLDYLTNSSDFFTAPASGRRHSSYEGGLVVHSINTYNRFKSLENALNSQDINSIKNTFLKIFTEKQSRVGDSISKMVNKEATELIKSLFAGLW